MNKVLRILFFFIFISIGISLNAQKTVSKQQFEEAIDYINCRITVLSFEDEVGRPNYDNYVRSFPNCNMDEQSGGYYNALANFLELNGLGLNGQLSKIINDFKPKYDPELTDDALYELIIVDLFRVPELQRFGNKAKRSKSFPALKQEIGLSVADLFNIHENQAPINPEEDFDAQTVSKIIHSDTSSERYTQLPGGKDAYELNVTDSHQVIGKNAYAVSKNSNQKTELKQAGASMNMEQIGMWLIVLMLFLAAYLLYKKGTFQSKGKKQKTSGLSMSSSSSNQGLNGLITEIQGLRSEIDKMHEEIEVLRYRVNEYEMKKIPLNEVSALPVANKVEKSVATTTTESTENINKRYVGETVFLPVPNADGTFDPHDALNTFKRTDSVYRFTIIAEDGNKAEFEVYPDIATMIRALDDTETYLKPACRSNAILHVSATKIITDEKGVAIFENGVWRVTKKAIIHYS